MRCKKKGTVVKLVASCNRLGNTAKIREACANIAEYAKTAACHTDDSHLLGYLNQIEMWAESALSAIRNI